MIKLFTKKNNLILSAILLLLLLFVIISPNLKLIEGNTESSGSSTTMQPCPARPKCTPHVTKYKTSSPHDTSTHAQNTNTHNQISKNGHMVTMAANCNPSAEEIRLKIKTS